MVGRPRLNAHGLPALSRHAALPCTQVVDGKGGGKAATAQGQGTKVEAAAEAVKVATDFAAGLGL